MYKHIIPVSFIGSGSSAFTDYLNEFANIDAPHGSFEYVFLHCPDGLFDLADKLLIGNNALRSDEALHSFAECMADLDNGRWWVGHYAEKIGPEFTSAVEYFLGELIEVKPDFYWYEQEKFSRRNYPYLALRKLIRSLTFNKKILPLPLTYNQMWLAWPTEAEFYDSARRFINKITNCRQFTGNTADTTPNSTETALIWDQLLLPHNLWRFPHYFDGTYVAMVITRDPRDVFLANKYFWAKNNEPVPYPADVKEFCNMYRKLRNSVQPYDHPQILTYAFEDLVYNYENTGAKIIADLGLNPQLHQQKLAFFNPKKSINNTQLWLSNKNWQTEAGFIEKELSEFCYDFPYKNKANLHETF